MATEVVLLEVAYQLTVPALAVAVMVTVPVPHLEAPLVAVMEGAEQATGLMYTP